MNTQTILNIVNTPANWSAGEVWHSYAYNKEFLIIETDGDMAVSIFISPLIGIFEDDIDIVVSCEDSCGGIALRATKGPLHRSQVDYFLGKVSPKEFEAVKKSLNVSDSSYNEDQSLLIADILNELHFVRLHAIELLETKKEV